MNIEVLRRELEEAGPSVVHKLYEWSDKKPDKTLLYYGEDDRSISYGEFNILTNRIAHSLAATGIVKGDRVAVYLNNPFITSMVMFASWKIGAVFCPINFSYRGRLLTHQLNDITSNVLISEQSLVPFLNDVAANFQGMKLVLRTPRRDERDYKADNVRFEVNKIFEKLDFDDLLKGRSENLDTEINYWDTASIIYTSGTTGPAKGVVHSHRWIANYTFTSRSVTHEDDINYNDLPMYHISGAFGSFARVVWTGSKIAMWNRFSPTSFWDRINKSGANSCALLDVMMPWLLNVPETAKDRDNSLSWVHMQPLPQYHNKIARRFGFDIVTVAYGSTETGNPIWGCIDELGDETGTPSHLYKGYPKQYIFEKFRQYGYPVLLGTSTFKKGFMGKAGVGEAVVLNEKDEILGPGERGELAFRSRLSFGLTAGYFEKHEATVEAFRNQWFHTGDICYMDEDGIYYFVDRMGDFMRVRGENVSTYQVEDAINCHPFVEVCAAFAIPAQDGEEDDIVLCATIKKGESIEENELRAWIQRETPKFMWPKYIRFVDAMPQTSTNKIEKYKLRSMILDELREGHIGGINN